MGWPYCISPRQTKKRKNKESQAQSQQKAKNVERSVHTLLHTLLSDSPTLKQEGLLQDDSLRT